MTLKTTVEILRDARSAIERNGWYQGEYVDRRPEFHGTPLRECPVCLLGALNLAYGRKPDDDTGESDAEHIIRELTGLTLPHWNDQADRTVEDVYTLLDKAIERAEAVDAR